MACLLFAVVGCGGREDKVVQAEPSELQAFEEQQKKDYEANLKAMKAAGANSQP
jgi:hypothetical protein